MGNLFGAVTDDNIGGSDNSRHQQAIQAALEASKKYGAASPEARVLWEIAEEIEDSIFSPCSERYVGPKRVKKHGGACCYELAVAHAYYI